MDCELSVKQPPVFDTDVASVVTSYCLSHVTHLYRGNHPMWERHLPNVDSGSLTHVRRMQQRTRKRTILHSEGCGCFVQEVREGTEDGELGGRGLD